jgi:superfamily II DNA or RNA helicase
MATADRQAVSRSARAVLSSWDELARAFASVRQAVAAAAQQRRSAVVWTAVDQLDLDRIKDVTDGGLRLNAIEAVGITTVGQLLRRDEASLDNIEGVGPATAKQALSAAAKVWHAAARNVSVLPDPSDASARSDPNAAALLAGLHHYQWVEAYARPVNGIPGISEVIARIRAGVATIDVPFTPGADYAGLDAVAAELQPLLTSAEVVAAVAALPQALQSVAAYPSITDTNWFWTDYRQRAADYAATLERTAIGEANRAHADQLRGGLSSDVADRVEAVQLDCRGLDVSLRGYQEFGIKFAVAQQRVILGDEMGLGKTIQALGAMAHLSATESASHFLVVTPASITGNWLREIGLRSTLPAHLLHGDHRQVAVDRWSASGGIAVTSYETLRAIGPLSGVAPSLLVVDEAHFVKNPDAARTRAVKAWVDVSPRVLFMSGTPLENRVDEFTALVATVNPLFGEQLNGEQAQLSLAGADPSQFREQVSPVYLRRNQEDVLHELPETIEMEEWVELTADDTATYRAAVAAGEIMGMRQAATLGSWIDGPVRSAKFVRLAELLEEYQHEGRKVVVFSYFRRVLSAVEQLLGPAGGCSVITGDVAPARRMALIDTLSTAPGFAVLACQIEAGGVGLNMQAASVVVLTEPQLKPSTEAQAIARAHRMGQTRKVVVHRLLARDAVDETLTTMLAQKQAVFDTYARGSALKEASTEATDLTEASLVQQVVAAEQARLAGVS